MIDNIFRPVSRRASGPSDENRRVVQFKISDETNKRAMPPQVDADLRRAIRQNEIERDLDMATLQAYGDFRINFREISIYPNKLLSFSVIPPKARGEGEFDFVTIHGFANLILRALVNAEFNITLLIDTDAPENFTDNKPFIEDFTVNFVSIHPAIILSCRKG